MSKSSHAEMGVLFVALFNLLGAFQEVYLGNLFQFLNPILVMVTTFLISGLFFLISELPRATELIALAKKNISTVFAVNISTAVSWVGFFYALRYLEPAIVSAMCFAIGPILSTLTSRFFRPQIAVLKIEAVAAVGTLLGILILVVSTLGGFSSLGTIENSKGAIGLSLSIFSALGIMGNTFFQKQLSESGFRTQQVMAVRFWFLIFLGAILAPRDGIDQLYQGSFIVQNLFIAGATVILPLYLLQRGIERLEPITISLILAAMPILTFFMQLFDTRLVPSFFSLAGITICLGFSVLGIVSRLVKIPQDRRS